MSKLSEYFTGVVSKRLSAVETDPKTSNQHEYNGIQTMATIFGREKCRFDCVFIYFNDDEDKTISTEGFLTWYDAREKHETRSEYRLYFQENTVMELASTEDLLVIGKKPDGGILALVVKANTTIERQILWLFGIEDHGNKFKVTSLEGEANKEIGYAERTILEAIGIETVTDSVKSWIDILLENFGSKLPTTKVFSEFARSTLPGISALETPDLAILSWINQEELLFRTLERHIVQQKIDIGFQDVDDFVKYSLSVQNTRKSRAGFALENHLVTVFKENNLLFSHGEVTENNSKPDFIFPGIKHYRDPDFLAANLTMLGSKTSCKDRWRQVLSEAKRIEKKHLFTLEPAISINQTNEMISHGLQLVLPLELHHTFSASQAQWLLSLEHFIHLVRGNQQF